MVFLQDVNWDDVREMLAIYVLRLKTGANGAFADGLRKLYISLLERGVSQRSCSSVIQVLFLFIDLQADEFVIVCVRVCA